MDTISSIHNPLIKEIKKQKSNDLLFLDTPKLIKEAHSAGVNFNYIFIQKGKTFDFISEINTEKIIVSDNIINSLSSVKTPAGIIAVAKAQKREFSMPRGNFLVLDKLQDAGNVGTLIRSALGADFKDIYLINCASVNSEKVIRSSMGAVFSLNCYEIDMNNFVENFANNTTLYCCDMNGDNVFSCKIKNNCGIVVGNEGNGVSAEIKAICSSTLRIPMCNNLESLNAAVSGSIIMYEIANRR